MQKTIVFCASEDHAERMKIALVNDNQDMVKENPDYCVRITGSDVYGKSKLDYFISVSEPYPVIATTSELLSTGADCKMTKLIVLDKTVESMTTFKQMIGRGTRIREKEGKTHFVVMDFRNVTRLFTDLSGTVRLSSTRVLSMAAPSQRAAVTAVVGRILPMILWKRPSWTGTAAR